MRFTLLLIITWLSQMDCKPLHDNHAMKSIIRNSLSETMTEKADAIDNLLRLLSEIDLPSICDALSAQQQGGNDKMATVDAILAEAAKSQAMTFIPTNFPEASKVTRPGVAPSDVVRGRKGQRQFEDSKQASQEVAISRSEGKLDGLSLDVASALTPEEQPHPNPTKTNNVDISISALSGYRKSIFSSPEATGASMKTTMTPSETTMSPSKTTDTPSNKTMTPSKTTMSPPTTNAPPKTTNAPSKTSMVPTHKTMTPPRTTRSPPKTTPAPKKTTRHPSTSTIITKATKKDTTIPTLASDMMLPDSLFGESGDGENMVEKVHPIETFTTLKMDDETVENKIYNPFEKKYKNIFMDRKIKDYELNKDSPHKLPKSTSSPEPKDAKTSEASEVLSSVYKTFVPDSTNTLSEQTTDMIDITPTVEDDLGWGFTLPQNTTFGEFMFGNITLNQTMSDELASILNSTVPVDFLISNDTIYNEFMSILNRTLVTSDSDIPFTPEPEFDMVISETGDIKNLIDYISNMTEKLSTFSPEVNLTTTSPIMNSTTLVDLVTEDLDNSTHIVNSNQGVLNSTLEADYSTYSAKVNSNSNTEKSSVDLKATIPTQKDYIHTKFPEYPPRREDKEVKSQTVSRPTAFTAGDYYPQTEAEKVDMLAGSNNFIQHEDIESKFKHSGFAPLNKNHNYKVNARKSGLTYLGFDFKNHHKSPYAPKPIHDQDAVQSLTKQKTIWSEPIKTDVSYPTGYTCPGLFGYFGDAHDCKAFFICSWGVPYRFHCPPGTIWSTAESVCNWSRDVTCSETS